MFIRQGRSLTMIPTSGLPGCPRIHQTDGPSAQLLGRIRTPGQATSAVHSLDHRHVMHVPSTYKYPCSALCLAIRSHTMRFCGALACALCVLW